MVAHSVPLVSPKSTYSCCKQSALKTKALTGITLLTPLIDGLWMVTLPSVSPIAVDVNITVTAEREPGCTTTEMLGLAFPCCSNEKGSWVENVKVMG